MRDSRTVPLAVAWAAVLAYALVRFGLRDGFGPLDWLAVALPAILAAATVVRERRPDRDRDASSDTPSPTRQVSSPGGRLRIYNPREASDGR